MSIATVLRAKPHTHVPATDTLRPATGRARWALRAMLPILAAAVSASAVAMSPSTSCAVVDEAQVAALFDRWNAALATGEPDQVLAQYAPDGVLVPTLSNEPRGTPAEIRDYFVHFLKDGPQGRVDQRRILLGCNLAQDIGTYTFHFRGGRSVRARYTFIYEWTGERWLIAHHHSSALPKPDKR